MSKNQDGEGQGLGLPDPDHDEAYARLLTALGETGAGLTPRPGWEAAVWAKIDAGAAREAGPRWRTAMLGGVMLAAAAALLLVWRPWRSDAPSGAAAGPDSSTAPALVAQIERVRGPDRVRADTFAVGDSVRVAVPVAGATIWIYRGDDRLLAACDRRTVAGPTCSAEGPGVAAIAPLELPATYHIVYAIDAGDPPATLDEALATLTRTGILHRHDSIDVF